MDDTNDGALGPPPAGTSIELPPPDEAVAPDKAVAPDEAVALPRRVARVLGKVAFWTVGTFLGAYFGLFSWMLSFHAMHGGCMYDVCIEQSLARGSLVAAMSGVTLVLWLKWGAWATGQRVTWPTAVIAGGLVALLPVLAGLFLY